MLETFDTLREKLAAAGDRQVAASLKKSLHSTLSFHGVRRPALQRILSDFAAGYRDLISLTPVNSLLVNLWKSNSYEERVLALRFLVAFKGLLGEREWGLLSEWTDSAENWSLSDQLSSVRAWLLRRYPERFTVLAGWASSESVWRRRSAVVSLLIVDPDEKEKPQLALPVRAALKVVEAAIHDTDPLVQKANAWITREIAREAPEHVAKLLDQYKWKAPKPFLIDAADGLPERLRKELLVAMSKPPQLPPPGSKKSGKKGEKKGATPGTAVAAAAGATPVAGKGATPAKGPARQEAAPVAGGKPQAQPPKKSGKTPPVPVPPRPKLETKPAQAPAPAKPKLETKPAPAPAPAKPKSQPKPGKSARPKTRPAPGKRPAPERRGAHGPAKPAKKTAAAGAGPRRPSPAGPRTAGHTAKSARGKRPKDRRGGSARR